MPEPGLRRSALDGADLRPRGIRLGERFELGKIDLRGDPGERAFMTAVGRVLDLLLPTEPCGSASKGQITVLWLAPDEWLLTCPAGDAPLFMRSLGEALGDVHAAVTDLTDGQVAFRVAGPSARDLLAKGCPLDLHPRAFEPASCARTVLAKTAVLIHLLDEDRAGDPAFDVFVARSFAHYLWMWLEDAGREFGVQVDAAA